MAWVKPSFTENLHGILNNSRIFFAAMAILLAAALLSALLIIALAPWLARYASRMHALRTSCQPRRAAELR